MDLNRIRILSCFLWVCTSLSVFLFPSHHAFAATHTWTNSAGGSWQNHFNWSPNGVPTSADDAVITLDNSYTVTIDGTANARTLTVGLDNTTHFITLDVNSGSLTLWNAGTLRVKSVLRVSGGTLNANFGLVINGTCQMTAGTFAANSSVTLNGAFALNGGSLRVNQPVAANGLFTWGGGQVAGLGTLTLNSTSTWTSGSMNEAGITRVSPLALLTLDGASDKVLAQRQLLNLGTLRWQGTGRLLLQGGSLLTNAATFQIANGSTMIGSLGTGTFYNAGLTLKSNTSGTATFETIGFINRSTVEVQNGTLQIKSGGTNFGTWSPGSAGKIDLTGGSMYFDTGTLLAGAGTTRLAGATLFVQSTNTTGVVVHSTIQQESGTLTGGGDLYVSGGAYNWLGGAMTGTGSVVFENRSIPGNVLTGAYNIAGNSDLTLARNITNFAKATWSSNGNLRGNNGVVFNNYGDFVIQNNKALRLSGAGSGTAPTFTNYGTIRKFSTGETLMDGWILNSEGLDAGNIATIDMQGGVFRFYRDTHTFRSVCALTGPGLIWIDGARFQINKIPIPPDPDDPRQTRANTILTLNTPVQMNSGSFGGGGPASGNGIFTWIGGTMDEPGGTTAQMQFMGSNVKLSNGRTVVNVGTGTWSGTGNITFLSARLVNGSGALFLIQNDALFSGGFCPGGTVRKLGTSGRTTFTGELGQGSGGVVETVTGTILFNASVMHDPVDGNEEPLEATLAPGPGTTIELRGQCVFSRTNTGGEGTVLLTNAYLLTATNRFSSPTVLGGNVQFVDGVWEPRVYPIRISGLFDWYGNGLISGTGRTEVLPSGTLRLSGALTKTNDMAELYNGGTIQWVGGDFRLVNDVTLINTNLFLLQGNSRLIGENGATFIGQAGSSVSKNIATGMSLVEDVNFQQSGAFNMQSGKLFFKSGLHTWLSGAEVLGVGIMGVTGAVFNIPNATTRVAVRGHFESAAGNLTGSGSMDVTGIFTWRGGLIDGKGSLDIQSGGNFTITGPGLRQISGRFLTNSGNFNWDEAGIVESSGFHLQNLGQMNLRGNGTWRHNGVSPSFFRNLGTIIRDPSLGTALWQNMNMTNAGIIRAQTGTLQIEPNYTQTAGTTLLEGGAITSPSVEIIGGEMRGVGTVNGTVTSGSFVRPGLPFGLLKISGNFIQTPVGTLTIDIGGPTALTQYDRLEVTDDASLTGKLQIVRTNGFMPGTNDTFTILSSGDRAGTFTPVTGRSLSESLVFKPNYTAGGVALVVTNIAPRFSSQPPEIVDGQLRFRLEGLEGEAYVVEYSQNLFSWAPLTTNTITGTGYVEVSDPALSIWPRRFYRARFLQFD